MDNTLKNEVQSATFERLIKHIKENAQHYVSNYKKYKNLGN